MAKTAIEFLQWLRPEGPWVLSAIVPDGRMTTRTFRADQINLMDAWIDEAAKTQNIHFHVNGTGNADLKSKAEKTQIRSCEFLHVDIDPTNDPSLVEAERKRILAKIEAFPIPPSCIIDSGNGYQAFWRLSEPVEIDEPSAARWAEFECYNRQLATDLGGDGCHNVDRIMRLPGTDNIPNKRKVSKGRTRVPATLLTSNDTIVDLKAFTKAPMIDGGDLADNGRATVDISGNAIRLNDMDDLDQYGQVSDLCKAVIVQGVDPNDPGRWPSRSEAVWFVACELVRCGIPDEVIFSILTDPDFVIAERVLEQKNPEGYAIRQIQRAKEHNIDEKLPGFNDNHFVTLVGGKLRVGKEQDSEIVFMEPGAFEKFHANKLVKIGEDAKGNPITKKLGHWWLEHPERRSYEGGVAFDPTNKTDSKTYNLWRGFAYPAVAGDKHQKWLDHIFHNVCGGNQKYYDYVIRWCARMIQNPATQSEVAIVMRGREGVGKNTFVNALGKLVNGHFFESSSSQQFLGNFNAHLRDKVLIHANEAFFAGDKKHEATLKMIITEATMPIEAKGVDIVRQPNYLHVIMSSNSDWVVPAGPDSRRFLVLDVSDAQRGNSAYFSAIKRDLEDGGYENLMRYLLEMDLTGWNVRDVPTTEALVDQRIRSMDPKAKWWMSRLARGYINHPSDGWAPQIEVDALWQDYIADQQLLGNNYRASNIELGRFINKTHDGIKRKRLKVGAARKPVYVLPTLEELREQFDAKMGGPFEWDSLGDEDLIVQGDIPF